tara:strand:+ start:36562 stop:37308 length:747 start_codon:yes stop_codon:yes gene_type:complete
MKNQKILVDREPLSKDYIQSKENFGHVLSQVKNLKPPVWKTSWFYGPVGLAVVAITVSAVSFTSKSNSEKQAKLEKVMPENVRELKVQKLAIISPKEFEKKSVREVIPKKVEKTKLTVQKKEEAFAINDEIKANTEDVESFSEEKTKSAKKKSFPNIGGVYAGKISLSTLCSSDGIKCGSLAIKSYTLQYFNGTKEVVRSVIGNAIPEDVCEIINEYNWGSTIFLTKIMGADEEGNVFRLPSMSFIPH